MRMLMAILALALFPLSVAERSVVPLEREIARVSAPSGGVVGVAAIHLETGTRVSLHGADRFPMASTVKIPVALTLLHRVDTGEERLDRMVEIQAADLHPGSGTLSDLFTKPGVALSVRNLLELMLLISDNSAADINIRLAGGPSAIRARMAELGIEGMDISRATLDLIDDSAGLPPFQPGEYSLEQFEKRAAAIPAGEDAAARRRFNEDPRDTTTPNAMAGLLGRLYRGELLKPESTSLLLDIMRRCRTGKGRLKGMLPEGTVVAHKTGTIAGSASDIGIITLPNGAGHIAIAVYVKMSDKDEDERDRGIAEIARSVYDYFLFLEPTK